MEEETQNAAARDAALTSLRAERGLRKLSSEEEGFGYERLPPGVYGFTYSPAEHNCPLFASPRFRNYEVHRLQDGSGLLLGYLTPDEARQLTSGQQVTIHLFPSPGEQAATLVSVALDRIIRPKEHSQRGEAGLELYLRPADRLVS